MPPRVRVLDVEVKPIRLDSSNLFRLVGVDDIVDAVPIEGATVTARIYDDRKDTRLTESAADMDTSMKVRDGSQFEDGDQVAIELADGTEHVTTLASILGGAGFHVLSLDAALTGTALEGARVSRKLGGDLTLTDYGTPAFGKKTGGYEVTMPHDHPDVRADMHLRVEIALDGGAGLRLLEVVRSDVVDHAPVR